MKYLFRILFIFLLLNIIHQKEARAQQTSRTARQPAAAVPFTDTKVISFHPLSLIAGSFRMGFEAKVRTKNSVKLIAGISLADHSDFYDVDNLLAFYIEMQYRYYIGNVSQPGYSVLRGVYAAPFILHKRIDYDALIRMNGFTQTKAQSANATGGGLIIGYQAVNSTSITVDMYAGGGMLAAFGEYDELTTIPFDQYRKGIIPQLGFSIGFSF